MAAQRRERRQGIGWSEFGSTLAVVLSIAALGVSLLEATTIRRAAEAEVWPYVDITRTYNAEGFGFLLINKGVGPAKIKTATLRYRGQVVRSLDELIVDVLGPDDAFSYERYMATDPEGLVVSPGEVVNLFSVDWDPVTRRLSEDLGGKLAIEACFCSVYDRCWRTTIDTREPRDVKSCKPEDAV
ncbi:MAG: hypothetical protein AAF830_06050 [Pseudomonadota bacterium]